MSALVSFVGGRRAVISAALFVVLCCSTLPGEGQNATPRAARKRVLAWADVRNGYQHDSISHALATIEKLGRESGAYDTWIRTDSQPVTKHPILFRVGTGIATGEQFLARDLNSFDAIFFFGVREIDLTAEQKADLLSFVKEDGKGFVAAHSASTAFFSWPEFGEMLGGRFDEHPWEILDAPVVVEDAAFPAMKGFPARVVVHDEHYQLKEFSRDKVRVLAHLDSSSLDLKQPLVHRTDRDFPVAWAKTYGKGRVFYSTLGHAVESWDTPLIQRMYFEAIRWALRLVDGDATPRPRGGAAQQDRTPIPGMAGSEPARLLFHEAWTRAPLTQPMLQENLGNQNLTLHLYGNASEIRKTMHPTDDYTYTGEATTNWAITVSDKASYWDLSGTGRIRLKTQNSGYRFVHVVIRTADGKYFASEEGSGESSSWIERDYVLSDLHWRNLLMTDTPTNASNRRQPDPKRVPIIPTSKGTPDLTKVDEVGFSDLMAGGWIPATARVASFDLYGKAVAR